MNIINVGIVIKRNTDRISFTSISTSSYKSFQSDQIINIYMRIYQDEIEDAMSDFEIKSCGHTQPINL
jgi:hypothetical protein